jgi:hypothetical protein
VGRRAGADSSATVSPKISATAIRQAHNLLATGWGPKALTVDEGGAAMARLMRDSLMRHVPGKQKGAMGYVLAWLLGVPLPILVIVALLRGCS